MVEFTLFDLAPLVGVTIGLVTVATLVYGVGKKTASMEVAAKVLDERQKSDINKMEMKLHDIVKEMEMKIHEAREERREQINKAVVDQIERFNNIQKQIDYAKGDVKGLLSKIEINETKINVLEDTPKELKIDAENSKRFFTDWIQRVEDRIEALRKEFLTMFTAFHGNGNMNKNDK